MWYAAIYMYSHAHASHYNVCVNGNTGMGNLYNLLRVTAVLEMRCFKVTAHAVLLDINYHLWQQFYTSKAIYTSRNLLSTARC